MDRAAESGLFWYCLNHPEATPRWLPEIGRFLHDPFRTLARALLVAHKRGLPPSPEVLRKIACKEMELDEGTFSAGWVESTSTDAMYMAKDPERCRRAILAYHEREYRRLGIVRLERAMGDDEEYRSEIERILEELRQAAPIVEIPKVESVEDLERELVDAPISVLGRWLLPVTGLGFIHAASGMGKTLFALQLAACVSRGADFLKWHTFPRRVLYLQGELSRVWWQGRSRALRAFMKQPLPEVHFCHESFPLMQFNRKSGSYNTQGLRKLRALVESIGADLVVIDPLSTYYDLEENSTDQNREFQKRLLDFRRDTLATVLLVHHDRKPSGFEKAAMRGSSVLRDYADMSIWLRHMKKDGPDGLTLTFDKVRHGVNPGSIRLLQMTSGFFTIKEAKPKKEQTNGVQAGSQDDDGEPEQYPLAEVEGGEPGEVEEVYAGVHEGMAEEEQGGEDGRETW